MEWAKLTIDQALEEASKTGKIVMVNVHSSHCGACAQLDADVWLTPEGVELAEGTIPISVDNAGPDGAYLQTRYPVTGLPAVIFIRPDGKEVDSVVGYMRGKQAFLGEALPLKDGIDRLPALEEQSGRPPGFASLDPSRSGTTAESIPGPGCRDAGQSDHRARSGEPIHAGREGHQSDDPLLLIRPI